jgi:hypothetical protein
MSESELTVEDHIREVNESHKILRSKIEALVKKADGDRRIVYETTLSDGGEVKLSNDTTPLFEGARVFPNRWMLTEYCSKILSDQGPVDCIVEVGVETGIYSAFMADLFKPKKMQLIDTKYIYFAEDHNRECMTKLEGFSSEVIPKLENNSISYAYIDAAHDYKSVAADIESILPKMKKSGIMQFNDYATFNLRFAMPYGVKAAVNRLIMSKRVTVTGYGLCPLGFDDVAVRVL